MMHYDAFNGDADGISSLVQLRLDAPLDSVLVTGTKRDNALLARVPAQPGDAVTVLDVSLATNRAALDRLLAAGVTVRYFDHHYAGDIPSHPALDAHVDTAPDVCTGVLVDRFLEGRQRIWAVVAAYGDNLLDTAAALAEPLDLAPDQHATLRALGDGLTYNAYSDDLADALVPPADLYRALLAARDPLRFVAGSAAYRAIDAGRRADLRLARQLAPAYRLAHADVYVLPDAPWTRRVRGLFGNEIANDAPTRAQAVLTDDGAGGYTVSVRAPRAAPQGADRMCREFATGGGRAAAAGIAHLPREHLQDFVDRLAATFC